MKALDLATRTLIVVGGVNWGTVAAAELDLVAKLTGNKFGKTSSASRAVYGAVGAAAAYQLTRLVAQARAA